jgi:hypothetical protein
MVSLLQQQQQEPSQQQLATSAAMKTRMPLKNNNNYTTTMENLKISCRPCANIGPEAGARAFVMGPNPLSIVLCSNRLSLRNTEEMEQVLTHELIHIYDVKIQKLDLRQCDNLAYSEVRAAREGECRYAWLSPSFCIHKCATIATQNLFPTGDQASACVSRVWERAMADHQPLVSSNNNNKHQQQQQHATTTTTTTTIFRKYTTKFNKKE